MNNKDREFFSLLSRAIAKTVRVLNPIDEALIVPTGDSRIAHGLEGAARLVQYPAERPSEEEMIVHWRALPGPDGWNFSFSLREDWREADLGIIPGKGEFDIIKAMCVAFGGIKQKTICLAISHLRDSGYCLFLAEHNARREVKHRVYRALEGDRHLDPTEVY